MVPACRAVVFDFFGTLTHSVRRGQQHAAVARTLGCDPDAVLGVLDRTFQARARGLYGSAVDTLRWVTEQAGGLPQADRLAAAVPQRVDALRADTRLRADAVTTLAGLRARGLRTAVLSDCTHELPEILPTLPVAPLLDAAVYSVQSGRCKPDPLLYLDVCERLGVRPADCLYVGDGGGRELTGAVAVGMTAVRLAAPDLAGHLVWDPDDAFTGPSVGELGELLTLLDAAPAYAAV